MQKKGVLNEEVYSIFIQYHNNELPLQAHKKVSSIISSCKECQEIYQDIECFFDAGKAMIFEMKNTTKVNNLRADARSIASKRERIHNIEKTFKEKVLNIEDLHCCGG